MSSVRKALGIAAWLVLGIQTKDARIPKKPQAKKEAIKKAASKPGRFSNLLKRIDQPVQPKNKENEEQSEKNQDQVENRQVAVPEPVTPGGEGAVGLKADVKNVPQVGSNAPAVVPPAVIPKPIALEDVIKNEAQKGNPAMSKAEEVDPGPEPVVKKIENIADIPKKPGDLKTETIPEEDKEKLEIKFERPAFDKKAEDKTEASKKIDIQETLSTLFSESMDEEVSSLDSLIASLPNVTIEDILTEIKDVESMLSEHSKAK